ncbi:hypothetical protein KJ885_04675 [Patescibacteria group bacterium]|nr:hypothetical protein [Patescibacteria group bacterium]
MNKVKEIYIHIGPSESQADSQTIEQKAKQLTRQVTDAIKKIKDNDKEAKEINLVFTVDCKIPEPQKSEIIEELKKLSEEIGTRVSPVEEIDCCHKNQPENSE